MGLNLVEINSYSAMNRHVNVGELHGLIGIERFVAIAIGCKVNLDACKAVKTCPG
jgi:hypothetical protein